MPHTSRRKRQPTRTKRQVTDLDDGWQRIDTAARDQIDDARAVDPLPGVDPELSVQKLSEELKHMQKRWIDSTCRARFVQILQSRMVGADMFVDTAVCLALGSVSRNWRHRVHSMWQLVLFLDTVNLLLPVAHERGAADKIRLFAQEPRFLELDVAFLISLGFTILNTPEAETYVGKRSFLYVPHLEWTSEIPYIRAAREAPLYMSSHMSWIIDEAERRNTSVENDPMDPLTAEAGAAIQTARVIQQTHHETKFPECELSNALSGSIYIKKDETDELAERLEGL
ncbi:hypothetical protein MBLNU459_g0733t1 [Dothideomycetes sp. NU459]